jgi:hypothetical protein
MLVCDVISTIVAYLLCNHSEQIYVCWIFISKKLTVYDELLYFHTLCFCWIYMLSNHSYNHYEEMQHCSWSLDRKGKVQTSEVNVE